jgi:hypothetical protein
MTSIILSDMLPSRSRGTKQCCHKLQSATFLRYSKAALCPGISYSQCIQLLYLSGHSPLSCYIYSPSCTLRSIRHTNQACKLQVILWRAVIFTNAMHRVASKQSELYGNGI